MKYLIEDTDEHTLGEINDYFIEELSMTSLNREDIVVAESLKDKIGSRAIFELLDDNGMALLYEETIGGMVLTSGDIIKFSKVELIQRFRLSYQGFLHSLSIDRVFQKRS
jgi:hypothetical protein